jgi:microcystin-dependent protein
MMATHFTLPRQQLGDTIGRPVSGAKAYFFAPGTTTPKNVFSDAGLTTAHSHPVEADSYGRFPMIYFGSGQYKVTLTDSAGSTIYTQDNIDPSISSGLASLPISQGGTGATTAGAARSALGVPSVSDLNAVSSTVTDLSDTVLIPGQISMFGFNTAPAKWLKCNGANVSRATYSDLFAAIGTTFGVGDGSTTFTLPDFRGYFPRGWADAGSVDSGRAFGSTQQDAFQGHWHTVTRNAQANISPGAGTLDSSQPAITGFVKDAVTDGVNGTPRTAAETRPVNIAILFCIYAGV